MNGKGGKQNTHMSERLDLIKQQQTKWIEQRTHTLQEEKKKKNKCEILSPTSRPQKGKNTDQKADTILWASNACSNDYTGFVVRKPNAKAGNRGSRPTSAKSSSSNKNVTHTRNRTQNKDRPCLKEESDSVKTHDNSDYCSSISEVDTCSINTEDTTDMDLPIFPNTDDSEWFATEDTSPKKSDTFTQLSAMSNHCCPSCKEVMVGQYAPYVVIPCGHSFCSLCLSGETFCPLCRVTVSSVEENVTLTRIISRFQMKKEEEEMKKKEADAKKYVDEYQSLSTRSNAMKEEASVIIENMENITNQILDKKKSIKSFVEKAGEIRKQVALLHEELNSLELKCSHESEAVKVLDDEYDSCKKQLVLAEKTIKSLEQSQERVKMIIEDFVPSLNLNS